MQEPRTTTTAEKTDNHTHIPVEPFTAEYAMAEAITAPRQHKVLRKRQPAQHTHAHTHRHGSANAKAMLVEFV